MRNTRRLRNTLFAVDYDFPVQLVYPAKLVQDSNLIQYELPEWSQFIGANRLAKLEHTTPIRPHHPQVLELSLNSAERKVSQSVTNDVGPPN
ncbi:hypothetical protein DPMN_085706 [Dreissena polymorpha]|uniref:Uncharacterized protein n=1 Tax=Dreissena polymorpha TaxID=45954 RepID=A0A9D3YE79_DREPO|nr:hypothetical protein DPMN_085706 [Dreissena polymorpha]